MGSVTKTITAQNVFSDSIQTRGDFNFSLSGTFVATVTIQRSFDLDTPVWHDMETYAAPEEDVGRQPDEPVLVRAGVKTGEFTSGSAVVRVSI